MNPRIYFDHSATTPLDPRVLTTMAPYLGGAFGNPSSLYYEGRVAREAVEIARAQVASLISAEPQEIIFTASGTEADNLALIGAVRASGRPGHVVTTSVEHAAILETCRFLAAAGTRITHLPVDVDGLVSAASLLHALQSNVTVVSVMAANNVVGTVQPIEELAHLTKLRCLISHRCSAGGGKDPARRESLAPRPALALSPQASRAEGCGRALPPQGHSFVADRFRWRAGTWSAFGHRKCRRNRWLRHGSGDCKGRTGRRSIAPRSIS